MKACVGDQIQIGGRWVLPQIAATRHAKPLRVAQKANGKGLDQNLGHIDQHQRYKDFVGLEHHPQNRRDHRPKKPPQEPRNDHQRKDQPARLHRVKGQGHSCPANCADDILTFGTDIPNSRPKPKGQPHGDQHQRGSFLDNLGAVKMRKGAKDWIPENRLDRDQWVFAQNRKQAHAENDGQNHRQDGRAICPPARRLWPFLKPKHGPPPDHAHHRASTRFSPWSAPMLAPLVIRCLRSMPRSGQ